MQSTTREARAFTHAKDVSKNTARKNRVVSAETIQMPTIVRGKVELGAEILLRIAREFDNSMEWLLTREERP